jgi:CspA family cold shock protein
VSEVDRLHGTLKWFSEHKGYGFLIRDDGSGDDFLHIHDLDRDGINISALEPGKTRFQYELHGRKNGRKCAVKLAVLP